MNRNTDQTRHASRLSFTATGRLICLVGAATLVVLLLVLGSRPFAAGLIPHPWDKLAHFAAYSAITGLLLLGTAIRRPFAVLTLVVAVGIFDELRQASLPGRVADATDFLVDFAAGVITGGLLLLHAHTGSGK